MANPWAAIIGRRADGKTKVLRGIVTRLQGAGRNVCGFVHERFEESGELRGYDLVDVQSGKRHPMARHSDAPKVCDWGFDEDVFDAARTAMAAAEGEIGVLELGPLEARGHGHWRAVLELLESPPRLLLLAIRPDVIGRVAVDLPDPVADLELPATPEQIERFVAEVTSAAESTRS